MSDYFAEQTLASVLATTIELFCNSAGRPMVRIPGDPESGVWPLRSARVRRWIAGVCWDTQSHLIQSRQVDALLNVLEAKAWSQPRRPCQPDELVEADAVVQAVVELVARQPQWQGLMSALLRRLNEVASTRSLTRTKGKWPRIAIVLGARLRRSAATLKDLGIDVSITHTKRGTLVLLQKVTLPADGDNQPRGDDQPSGSSPQSSPTSSPLNASHEPDLDRGDDGDDENGDLFAPFRPSHVSRQPARSTPPRDRDPSRYTFEEISSVGLGAILRRMDRHLPSANHSTTANAPDPP